MTPAAIIEQVKADGVALTLSEVGILRANGYGGAVNRWLPTIRRQKEMAPFLWTGFPRR